MMFPFRNDVYSTLKKTHLIMLAQANISLAQRHHAQSAHHAVVFVFLTTPTSSDTSYLPPLFTKGEFLSLWIKGIYVRHCKGCKKRGLSSLPPARAGT
jgi:hypothetical protein